MLELFTPTDKKLGKSPANATSVIRARRTKSRGLRPRQTIADQGRLQQTKAHSSRPKHFDIRGATSISDAFIKTSLEIFWLYQKKEY